ncbi:TPA: SufS family cysteine desulfurase [Candidatus Micrarchaeota archaeon]|nr:SufS family cysteine desulfurase [Candidatus Micrarchaeota archaeon]
MLDPEKIRKDFPIFKRKFKGSALAYLDNAATTQKPCQVMEAMDDYYRNFNANPHRGAYRLVADATERYESARKNIAAFIGARQEEIIFTRNATESLNLVATVVCQQAAPGSSILLTQMEHHSNIVPWQMNAKRHNLRIKYAKIRSYGALCMEDMPQELAIRPAVFSFTHVSNVLGTINDAVKLCRLAHESGALACVDAAQSVPHMKVDVRKIGCDFLAFSGHKMLGPTGIGVLYMRRDLQETLPPFLVGGDMIKEVTFEGATWNSPPYKFEAGTPNVAGAVGLSAAVDYLKKIGMEKIEKHEQELASYCREKLSGIPGIKFYGPKKGAGIVSYNIGKLHAHDVGQFADEDGIAIRTGHHCAQPLMKLMGEPATCRASVYIYNSEEEVHRLAASMKRAQKTLG